MPAEVPAHPPILRRGSASRSRRSGRARATGLTKVTISDLVAETFADTLDEVFEDDLETPESTASDGIVPLYSQIWGELIWVGKADHLDIVGHFPGAPGKREEGPIHTDWLASGARFNRVRFDVVMDRIVAGLLVSEELHQAAPTPAV